MASMSLKSAACELPPNVNGSVALVALNPSPTPTATTTTTTTAAIGNLTFRPVSDLGDEIPVRPATVALSTSDCEATSPKLDMAPKTSAAVRSDSTTRYHSLPQDDSDEEVLDVRLLVSCDEPPVDRCPDGLDCPFCGDATLCASDCDSDLSEMLQVNRVKDGPLLPTTGILTDTAAKITC